MHIWICALSNRRVNSSHLLHTLWHCVLTHALYPFIVYILIFCMEFVGIKYCLNQLLCRSTILGFYIPFATNSPLCAPSPLDGITSAASERDCVLAGPQVVHLSWWRPQCPINGIYEQRNRIRQMCSPFCDDNFAGAKEVNCLGIQVSFIIVCLVRAFNLVCGLYNGPWKRIDNISYIRN